MARKKPGSGRKPTIGEILASGKRKAAAKRKQQIAKAKLAANIPIKGAPPFVKPAVRSGVAIADVVSRISEAVVNQVIDRGFRDFQNLEIPSPQAAKTILPNVDQINQTIETVKERTDAQLINDEIMRRAMTNANSKGRKKNGDLKKGMTQSKLMRMARKECTAERERLGLCEKPMKKKGTRKGQVRKTARRAFEK
jgi:hypothetical protein